MKWAKYSGELLGALLTMAASSSQAAVVTTTFDITASNFVRGPGVQPPTVPPYPTVHLNFTATFDDSNSFGPTTSGLTINSNTLPYTAEYEFDATADVLTIGTDIVNASTIQLIPNSFGIFIDNALTSMPLIFGIDYMDANGQTFQDDYSSVIVSSTVSAVSLPASAPMFGAALMALGAVGYSLKRKGKAQAQVA